MPNPLYHPPVAELLNYGAHSGNRLQDWPDYVQELALTAEHIPELIQMAQDERLWQLFFSEPDDDSDILEREGWDLDIAFWAPIHAWRALGQLRAAEAVKPLAYVLERWDVEWCWEELPEVFGLIGADAIQPLDELLAENPNDRAENARDLGYSSKITLVSGLTQIVQNFPAERDRCVEVLARHLSNYENQHISLNGSLVTGLYKLKALEAVPVMEAAYTAGKVDEMFVGSWARVQVDLGLKQESDFTAEELAIHHTPEQAKLLANIRASFNQRKPSAFEQGLPVQRETFRFDKPPSFKDIAAASGSQKSSHTSGFGQSSKPNSQKGRKKKKK
ncbi:MAG: hypothetical protein ACFBSF_07255 [Leptolyngbyaceae cyanobacterium]